MRSKLAEAEHWVVKIGSAVLLRDSQHMDRPTFVSLVRSVDQLINLGHRVTLVSSGAVALGRQIIENDQRFEDLPSLQALAALGQARLIRQYDEEFREYDRRAAQILFGRADLDRRQGFLNARMTLESVHRLGAVPIINENDTVATEGLRFDDNDELAAMACGLVKADVLVILSDVEGVFDVEEGSDGVRRFTRVIEEIAVDDPRLEYVAGPSRSRVGRGGMISKIAAARAATRLGIPAVIAPGKHHGILESLRDGASLGTLITPGAAQLQGRKVWLGSSALAVGRITCDDGAVHAVANSGASLLPSGITAVEGDFVEGAVVELADSNADVFAKGIVVYPADDIRLLAGRQSEEIQEILGYRSLDAIIHRDSMVLV